MPPLHYAMCGCKDLPAIRSAGVASRIDQGGGAARSAPLSLRGGDFAETLGAAEAALGFRDDPVARAEVALLRQIAVRAVRVMEENAQARAQAEAMRHEAGV